MPESFDSMTPGGDGQEMPDHMQPYGEEAPIAVEDDAPRRAASARFIVDGQIGSDAAMRDAMDPANQSLADALRLSFRVLQAVILILVVLFLASGFRTVKEGQSGVATVWGKITSVDSDPALLPGPKFSVYPYPIGDFHIFDVENRTVNVNEAFAPRVRGTQEEMLERAEVSNGLIPGFDGSLLTKDGDLVHLKLNAKYNVDQPVDFVKSVDDAEDARNGNKLVQLALQRAAIHVTAGLTLQDLVELKEDARQKIQTKAQEVLDDLHCGIQIAKVELSEAAPPLAIQKSQGDVTDARVAAAELEEKAVQNATTGLQRVAGDQHAKLTALIEQYEAALDRADDAESKQRLDAINAILDSNEVTGEVSDIIQYARTYQWEIASTLGIEYRQFQSLLPAYKADPKQVVMREWYNAFAKVVSRPDTEIMYVPNPLMGLSLNLSGDPSIQDLRNRNDVARRQREADAKNFDPHARILRQADMTLNKISGRQLPQTQSKGSTPSP